MGLGGLSMAHFQGDQVRPPESASGGNYPTHVIVPDSGCDLYGRCLECPLPMCRYDYTNRKQLNQDVKSFLGLTTNLKPQRDRI